MSQQHNYTEKTIDQLLNDTIARSTISSASITNTNNIASDLLKLLENNKPINAHHSEQRALELTSMETRILRSKHPIEITDSEEITVLGQVGKWINKSEVISWKGDIPITEYLINEDKNPEIILKSNNVLLEYVQELAIRYLKPPTPMPLGDIVITQEPNKVTRPAPPLIIRQQPARELTPEPLIFREEPPKPPQQIKTKIVTISGKRLPPPPRKVVIERLAQLPPKPQPIIIERWLPYVQELKRRVIFKKSELSDPVPVKPKNVIIQWESPEAKITTQIKYLGVTKADPNKYVQAYGVDLMASQDLPKFVTEIETPLEVGKLACEATNDQIYELEGDLEALKLIDMEKEGLGVYMKQVYGSLNTKNINTEFSTFVPFISQTTIKYPIVSNREPTSTGLTTRQLISQIFEILEKDGNGLIRRPESESVFLKIINQLGRSYPKMEVDRFFALLDKNGDGLIKVSEFREAFISLI